MAANFIKKIGNSYNFGVFAADTPIEAEFDKPVKEIRVPLALDLLAGSRIRSGVDCGGFRLGLGLRSGFGIGCRRRSGSGC